jgi:hypothetical protein
MAQVASTESWRQAARHGTVPSAEAESHARAAKADLAQARPVRPRRTAMQGRFGSRVGDELPRPFPSPDC